MFRKETITALDWVLLKDINLALASRPGPEINSRACLWVPPRPRHLAHCWLVNRRLSLFFLFITPRDPQGRFRSEESPSRATHCKLRRKCYKSSEEAGLLHISAFSASFPFLLFFKVLLLRKLCYQNKRKFSSKPGSIPREKNFDFSISHWKLHNRLIKHAPAKCYYCTLIQTHLLLVATERSAVVTLIHCLGRTRSTSRYRTWWDRQSFTASKIPPIYKRPLQIDRSFTSFFIAASFFFTHFRPSWTLVEIALSVAPPSVCTYKIIREPLKEFHWI